MNPLNANGSGARPARPTKVKVCGLRRPGDVIAAVHAGADLVGFVLTASPRRVEPLQARALASLVPAPVLTVGVVQERPLREVISLAGRARVDAVQLHGDYDPADIAELKDRGFLVLRAVGMSGGRMPATASRGEDLLIVDAARPGSGETWDWTTVPDTGGGTWMLAGGLHPGNVAEAIDALRPWGVDVSSGVERQRGMKDPVLIADFVAAAKGASLPAARVPVPA